MKKCSMSAVCLVVLGRVAEIFLYMCTLIPTLKCILHMFTHLYINSNIYTFTPMRKYNLRVTRPQPVKQFYFSLHGGLNVCFLSSLFLNWFSGRLPWASSLELLFGRFAGSIPPLAWSMHSHTHTFILRNIYITTTWTSNLCSWTFS